MGDVKKILGALLLGVFIGGITPMLPGAFQTFLMGAYGFFGTLFMNALKMIIVPLVAASIITGVAGMGKRSGLGSLGLKTFFYYMATSLVAVVTGVFLVNLITPGVIDGKALGETLSFNGLEVHGKSMMESVGQADFSSILNVFLDMVPPNVIEAAVNGQMLGIITFSLLFGLYMPRITREYKDTLFKAISGIHEIMISITDLVMRFAPLGIFALCARVVAEAGAGNIGALFKGLGLFFITVVLALFVHAGVTLSLVALKLARKSPLSHFMHMAPALITAFSTASSSATLPITLECLEKRAGVSERVTGFVIPLGATINMDGTALYECVSALFIAQVLGVQMGILDQIVVVWIAVLTSIGVAGIPAASLVAIAIILKAVGLPVEAMAIILPVDRFLDMLRTSVNVLSDSVGAIVIERLENA